MLTKTLFSTLLASQLVFAAVLPLAERTLPKGVANDINHGRNPLNHMPATGAKPKHHKGNGVNPKTGRKKKGPYHGQNINPVNGMPAPGDPIYNQHKGKHHKNGKGNGGKNKPHPNKPHRAPPPIPKPQEKKPPQPTPAQDHRTSHPTPTSRPPPQLQPEPKPDPKRDGFIGKNPQHRRDVEAADASEAPVAQSPEAEGDDGAEKADQLSEYDEGLATTDDEQIGDEGLATADDEQADDEGSDDDFSFDGEDGEAEEEAAPIAERDVEDYGVDAEFLEAHAADLANWQEHERSL